MAGQSSGIIDKLFFIMAFVVMAFVALNPDSFIRAITLGRSNGGDVSYFMLRMTQIIAGIAAVSIAVSLIISFLQSGDSVSN